MKKLVLILLLALPLSLMAAGSSYPLDSANVNLNDRASLQRGAKYFVNYCLGCHSMNYQRYNRMGADLGLTDQEVIDNLIFTTDKKGEQTKVGELMTIAMDADYAEQTFGVVPPDLNLTSRSRGADWIYTYLKTFYRDDSRPLGVNNAAYPAVGMPHVLESLQGIQKAIYEETTDSYGNAEKTIVGFEIIEEGQMSIEEYDQLALDITNFMVYSGEPAKLIRTKMGWMVLLALALFGCLAYALKKEYWRDVH